jgi:hypothetical protein
LVMRNAYYNLTILYIFIFLIMFLSMNIMFINLLGTVMQCSRTLVKHTKKEIKERFNIEKVIFYIFNVLNAHILRQIFYECVWFGGGYN